jgi:nucleoside-diphosphate-sugar epimerase
MSSGSTLVAGAGGFIGGHLVNELAARGHQVRAVDAKPLDDWHQGFPGIESLELDLSRLEECRRAVQGVDTIYDLAADMGGIGFIEGNKAECMLSVLIGTHLLVAARDAGVDRFFFASSACVYPADRQNTPEVVALAEDHAYPATPEDGYGWEKLFTERMCRHFAEDFGMATRVARYHNVYGPHGAYDGGREKAPAAICRKVATAALTGEHQIEIWGDGQQTRSFVYIEDCVEGTIRIAEGDALGPLNLGSTELVTIDQLVDIVEEIAGIELERSYDTDAPQGVRGRNSDNTLIRESLGWEPTIPLRAGLEATYTWVRDQVAQDLEASLAR